MIRKPTPYFLFWVLFYCCFCHMIVESLSPSFSKIDTPFPANKRPDAHTIMLLFKPLKDDGRPLF